MRRSVHKLALILGLCAMLVGVLSVPVSIAAAFAHGQPQMADHGATPCKTQCPKCDHACGDVAGCLAACAAAPAALPPDAMVSGKSTPAVRHAAAPPARIETRPPRIDRPPSA